MMNDLKGRCALVTGASAGIGLETVRLLAAQGVFVWAAARRRDKLESLKREFPEMIGPVVVDLTQDLSPLESALKKRPCDILINNAGLALGRETLWKTSKTDWNQMIDLNVKSLIAVTQLVLPGMKEKDDGDILNIGSIAGMQVYAQGAVYCATKYAVRAITDALRLDLLGTNVRVMGVHPGMVETEFSLVRYRGDQEKAKNVYEGMRPLTGIDIAQTILWCLQRPRHVTIQSILVMPTDQGGVGSVHRRK